MVRTGFLSLGCCCSLVPSWVQGGLGCGGVLLVGGSLVLVQGTSQGCLRFGAWTDNGYCIWSFYGIF